MAFSRLYSCLKSLNRSSLRNSFLDNKKPQFHIKNAVIDSETKHKPNISWLNSLLPVAIAFSAGSFAFQTLDNPALCDSSNHHPQRYSLLIKTSFLAVIDILPLDYFELCFAAV